MKVDSTTAYVLVWRPCLSHWAWEWRHLNLSNWIWYVGLVFIILSNYVDFSWCQRKWCFTQVIPDPLLLMCSSLVKYYNVAQVWVVCGYLDGLSRNCCFLQKSESKSTGFSSGFPVTVGFPKKILSDAFRGFPWHQLASAKNRRFFPHQSNMWAFTLVRPGILERVRLGILGEQKRLGFPGSHWVS